MRFGNWEKIENAFPAGPQFGPRRCRRWRRAGENYFLFHEHRFTWCANRLRRRSRLAQFADAVPRMESFACYLTAARRDYGGLPPVWPSGPSKQSRFDENGHAGHCRLLRQNCVWIELGRVFKNRGEFAEYVARPPAGHLYTTRADSALDAANREEDRSRSSGTLFGGLEAFYFLSRSFSLFTHGFGRRPELPGGGRAMTHDSITRLNLCVPSARLKNNRKPHAVRRCINQPNNKAWSRV